MMIFDRGNRSADQLYLEARAMWAKVISLSIHDSEDMLHSVISLLEKARRRNSRHIPSLVLLSDLLMALGADSRAMEVVNSLLSLQPNNQTHTRKKVLLQQFQANRNSDNRDAVREFIEMRWTQTSDW